MKEADFMFDPAEAVREFADEIIALRHAIHRRPELGNREYETAELAERTFRAAGIETRRALGTAVLGLLRGGSGAAAAVQTVALRADLDALPLNEETGADFASEIPGVMHACGHDVHTAAVLGAALVLAKHRDEIPGNVLFIFQPDEEGSGGGARLVQAGCLDGVDAIFGAHVSPDLPAGHIGIRYGKFYAASDMFEVTLTGRSAHGAEREKGTDALAAASRLVTELLALPKQVTDDRCVLTVGRFESGTAKNILPGEARIEGIIRTLGPETRAAVKEQFFNAVNHIAEESGTTAEINYIQSYPGVVNDDKMTALAERAANRLAASNFTDTDAVLCADTNSDEFLLTDIDNSLVHRISEPTMTTEDFGYYLEQVPGSFYHVGAGCSLPLHNPGFMPTDDALLAATAMHISVVQEFFIEQLKNIGNLKL